MPSDVTTFDKHTLKTMKEADPCAMVLSVDKFHYLVKEVVVSSFDEFLTGFRQT
jgi:hypothetical protein